jgi:hypothetical protein
MTIPKPFSVQTFDAYESPPYSGDPLNVGSFSTADAALECAKKVVDDQLRISIESGYTKTHLHITANLMAAASCLYIPATSTAY